MSGEFFRRHSPGGGANHPGDPVGANHTDEFIRRHLPGEEANHTGEFIRRHSPGEEANHPGEFIRRYSPGGVGANHPGEFIRRYSPGGGANHARRIHSPLFTRGRHAMTPERRRPTIVGARHASRPDD